MDCALTYFLPLTISSGNGELVAHSALPFDHVYAWCGVHSAFDVGLESGKTHGKSAFSNIASTMSFVMRPGQPETQMIVAALNVFTSSSGVLTPGTFSCMYGLLNSKRS